jgi:hypothetical protein
MATALVALLTFAVGAGVSGVGTYYETRRKLVLEYDADLRTKRIEAYANLWCRLKPLARYSAASTFSSTDASKLAESLRIWYFEKGGLFLSPSTRTDYFALQDILAKIAQGWGRREPPLEDYLSPDAREYLRLCGSRLRTGMTRDVGSRTRPKIRGDIEPVDRTLAGEYRARGGQGLLTLKFRPRLLGGTRRVFVTSKESADGRSTKVKVQRWNRARLIIVLADANEKHRERVLVVESRKLIVEGPPLDEKGPLLDEKTPKQPVLWERVPEHGAQSAEPQNDEPPVI